MNKSITYSIVTIAILSICSKVLGLLREAVTANYFGTSTEMDILFLFNSIITIVIFFALSASISYLPVFISKMELHGEKHASVNFSKLLNQYFLFSIVLTSIIYLTAPVLFKLLGSAFPVEYHNTAVTYIRIFSLSIFFSGSVYLFTSVLNGMKLFGRGQIVIMLYSIIAIIFTVCFHGLWGPKALQYAWLTASTLQFIILFFMFFRGERKYSFEFGFKDLDIKKIRKSIIPIFIGSETYMLCLAVDRIIGSTLKEEGIVSALSYAALLYGLVNTVLSSSIITVYYTEFSQNFIAGGISKVIETLKKSCTILFLILSPICVFLALNGTDFISIVLKRGAFTDESVHLTALVFCIYILIAPLYAIRLLFSRVFYTIGDRITPMKNGVVLLVTGIFLGYTFSRLIGIQGIPLAAFITTFAACAHLAYKLSTICPLNMRTLVGPFIKIMISLIASVAVLIICSKINMIGNIYYRIIINFILYIFIFLSMLVILKNEELTSLIKLLKKKLIKH